jgi:hypothetical protein
MDYGMPQHFRVVRLFCGGRLTLGCRHQMNRDQDLSFLFCCHRVLHSGREDQHLSGSQFMYLISGRNLHAATQNVNVDDSFCLVRRQASESVEGKNRDSITPMMIQGFLSMASFAGLGFRSKFAGYRFKINQQLRDREPFLRMLSQACFV